MSYATWRKCSSLMAQVIWKKSKIMKKLFSKEAGLHGIKFWNGGSKGWEDTGR